ncbi:hypothetical protein MKW98_011351 [Papaver atlanticum]|uniref:Uncharacterized protein n=1 Tax=Papaver atlanticum TaxID=357466 RepID=A0AAD4SW73_9MAGN|nr:hypothetical protein MKW98_011351 [Papaver atlanticum]
MDLGSVPSLHPVMLEIKKILEMVGRLWMTIKSLKHNMGATEKEKSSHENVATTNLVLNYPLGSIFEIFISQKICNPRKKQLVKNSSRAHNFCCGDYRFRR